MKLDQVDTESRVLHVARLKGGLATTQPLRSDELRAISAWLKEHARMKPIGKAFFVSEQRKQLHRSTVNLLMQTYSKAASLPLVAHPHMLRHACGFARRPNSSALAQTGWNFGSGCLAGDAAADRQAAQPQTLDRVVQLLDGQLRVLQRATVAKATKRSGVAAQNSASFSFWILISSAAASRSARYQYGLMLSASTSTPSASISAMRSVTFDHSSPGASSGWLITAAA